MARFTAALCLAAALVLFLPLCALFAAAAPTTLPQIALYQGADRDKILLEGAKKEGQLTLYDSHTWFRTYVKDFEKKYPFIKVSEWRSDSKNLLSRAMTGIHFQPFVRRCHRNDRRGHGSHETGRACFKNTLLPKRGIIPMMSKPKGKTVCTILATEKPITAWASTPR